jgi:ATP-binding cassette subfamily B (MDR/TAP) protein 1
MNKPTRVMLIEGLDPLLIVDPNMQSWKKEMIEFVGGQLVDKMTCQQQEEEDFVVILSLYGLDIKQTKQELQHVLSQQEQEEFTQFLNSQKKSPFVYLMDGTSSIFSCPTPQRLLETIQWLIQILYGISHKEEEEIDTSSIAHKFLSLPRSRTSTSCSSQMMKEIEELHHLACINKESMYKDPKTGYSVLTSFYLQQRGICCGNGCRHCPYGHVNVKDPTRQQNQLKKPMLIHPKPIQVGSNTTNKTTTLIRPSRFWFDGTTDSTTDTDGTGTTGSIDNFWIMFWSGGKKSFLALSEFVQTISSRTNSCLILLTTIDPETRMVPIQNISMKTILQQAKHMDLPVCMVPVPQGSSNQVYTDHVFEALDTIFHSQQHDQAVVNLIFGDLHVQEIRMWREQVFDSFHQKVHLHFPLWQKDVASELLPMLERICQVKKVSIQFTTDVLALNVKQGDVFDSRQILNRQKSKAGITGSIDDTGKLMNKTIDLMGESHTCIHFHF